MQKAVKKRFFGKCKVRMTIHIFRIELNNFNQNIFLKTRICRRETLFSDSFSVTLLRFFGKKEYIHNLIHLY